MTRMISVAFSPYLSKSSRNSRFRKDRRQAWTASASKRLFSATKMRSNLTTNISTRCSHKHDSSSILKRYSSKPTLAKQRTTHRRCTQDGKTLRESRCKWLPHLSLSRGRDADAAGAAPDPARRLIWACVGFWVKRKQRLWLLVIVLRWSMFLRTTKISVGCYGKVREWIWPLPLKKSSFLRRAAPPNIDLKTIL